MWNICWKIIGYNCVNFNAFYNAIKLEKKLVNYHFTVNTYFVSLESFKKLFVNVEKIAE
jgi:hypothetical protein